MKLGRVVTDAGADTVSAPRADIHPAYRPDIDGLRAVAVLAVVLFHAFPGSLRGGFVGVDIFFVISGFLIGGILIRGLQQGRLDLAGFYARRVRRIFPALAVVLAACLAFGWFALFADEFKMLGKHVFGGAAFVSNFFLWNEVGYFDTAAETKPLLHLWSLGIEEQFYIFWPLLLALAWRLRVSLLGLALGLGAASFLLNVAGVHGHPSATFYSPASRAWELLAGAALAYASVNHLSAYAGVRRAGRGVTQYELSSPRARHALSLAGAALLALAVLLVQREKAFPGFWALLPVLGALLLIGAGPQAVVNRWILASRPMVAVGLVSYPLYLWHWPLLSYAHIIESGVPALKIRAAAVAAALVLAALTYWLIEKPLRSTRRGGLKVALLAAVVAALGAVGGAVYFAQGLPGRASVVENGLLQKDLVLVEDVANAAACKARYGFASLYEYCLLDDVKRDPTVVLIGDSHAYHLVAGQTRYWRSRGENLWLLGTRVPFIGIPGGSDDYQKATPRMLDLALHTASVKTVIISTAIRLHEGNDEGRMYVAALRDTLRQFLAAGKEVILVRDLPHLNFEPRACIRRAGVASSQTRADCSLPRKDYDQPFAGHNAIVDRVLKEFPRVKVFDTAAQLCDARRCLVKADGMLLYRDLHHLSYRGDLWMGERFARQFGSAR
ncbi:MAG TPA: acyltransferase family protein [Telluria sp.]|nr:acyltransferase family protein [Telluria sp.]